MEYLIAFHCAPALSGIKPSNIINCNKNEFPDLKKEICRLNKELNKRGIYIEILCECNNKALVMVYRKTCLTKYLEEAEIQSFLLKAGYPKNKNTDEYIAYLKKRLSESSEFPHEIGAFLGYPIQDIYGFINKNKSKCLYTGYWKVYANVEESKEKFRRYDKCRAAVLKRMDKGQNLSSIFGCA